jgi:hypothetical protein
MVVRAPPTTTGDFAVAVGVISREAVSGDPIPIGSNHNTLRGCGKQDSARGHARMRNTGPVRRFFLLLTNQDTGASLK